MHTCVSVLTGRRRQIHYRRANFKQIVVYSEPPKKGSLSPIDETKSKLLTTESRDRTVRHADVTSGEEEYDAKAHKHLSVDCSVCRRV